MPEPRVGMNYEDVRRRVKRIVGSTHGNPEAKVKIVESLLNQAERANKGSRRELERELSNR